MSWFAAGLWLLVLVIGMPVGAEEFTVVVFRGSEIVRVTGNEGGEFREETLREDPTPEPPPREIEAPAPRASDDSGPTIQIIVEAAYTTSPAGYVVVQPRAPHHRRPYVGPDPHRGPHGGRGLVRRAWHPGHDGSMHTRSVGYGRWSPPR